MEDEIPDGFWVCFALAVSQEPVSGVDEELRHGDVHVHLETFGASVTSTPPVYK